VVPGGEMPELRGYGVVLDKDGRYARPDELLRMVTGLWEGRTVDFSGQHLVVAGAALHRPPDPRPRLYFGGSSPAALRVAARRVDTYLTWGEPPAAVADKLDRVRQLAAEAGRSLEYGIRLHVITRDTSAEAWREAE